VYSPWTYVIRGVYILFNGNVFVADSYMKSFIQDIKEQGFRLNSFPEDMRPLARSVGNKLKSKKFLI